MKQFLTEIGETYWGKRFVKNYDKHKDRFLTDFDETKNELTKEMKQFKLSNNKFLNTLDAKSILEDFIKMSDYKNIKIPEQMYI